MVFSATLVVDMDVVKACPSLIEVAEGLMVYVSSSILYTRTWPALFPPPSFHGAPMAIVVPSSETRTDEPERSPIASQLI